MALKIYSIREVKKDAQVLRLNKFNPENVLKVFDFVAGEEFLIVSKNGRAQRVKEIAV